jgi:transposase
VRWHKVQYACRETGCDRSAFTEQIAELPARARVTGRLLRHVADRVSDGLPVSGACAGLMSWPIGHAAFVAAAVELVDPEPVTVLGMDETRRGQPRWTKDAEDGRWVKLETFETNFVDLAGTQGLLGQASGRTKANVVAWLDERGQVWKDAVQIVAIDPCATYRATIAEALPHARIVADQ